MIALEERKTAEEQQRKVLLIDLLKDPDIEEAKKYVTETFCKKDWDESIEVCEDSDFKTRWLVVSDDTFNYYDDYDQVMQKYKKVHLFEKKDRSSFKYWFAHWCAFQMTALNLGAWKWKYLFHDIEKPWLKLFWDYSKVQKWHREHSKHHLEYGKINGFDHVDWEALMIDWECCRFTKKDAQLDARETLEYEVANEWRHYDLLVRKRIGQYLNKYDL